ncbi:hypothetical protein CCR75_007021 [Bremia lactucae]|uniref:RxLR effector protein n=1 Tax=Bremia lactucae TaxID=4779 RepID=A0A976FP55_BRELC|nr:hypothetical protein CCR75_007021 [Bremia lactucae]
MRFCYLYIALLLDVAASPAIADTATTERSTVTSHMPIKYRNNVIPTRSLRYEKPARTDDEARTNIELEGLGNFVRNISHMGISNFLSRLIDESNPTHTNLWNHILNYNEASLADKVKALVEMGGFTLDSSTEFAIKMRNNHLLAQYLQQLDQLAMDPAMTENCVILQGQAVLNLSLEEFKEYSPTLLNFLFSPKFAKFPERKKIIEYLIAACIKSKSQQGDIATPILGSFMEHLSLRSQSTDTMDLLEGLIRNFGEENLAILLHAAKLSTDSNLRTIGTTFEISQFELWRKYGADSNKLHTLMTANNLSNDFRENILDSYTTYLDVSRELRAKAKNSKKYRFIATTKYEAWTNELKKHFFDDHIVKAIIFRSVHGDKNLIPALRFSDNGIILHEIQQLVDKLIPLWVADKSAESHIEMIFNHLVADREKLFTSPLLRVWANYIDLLLQKPSVTADVKASAILKDVMFATKLEDASHQAVTIAGNTVHVVEHCTIQSTQFLRWQRQNLSPDDIKHILLSSYDEELHMQALVQIERKVWNAYKTFCQTPGTMEAYHDLNWKLDTNFVYHELNIRKPSFFDTEQYNSWFKDLARFAEREHQNVNDIDLTAFRRWYSDEELLLLLTSPDNINNSQSQTLLKHLIATWVHENEGPAPVSFIKLLIEEQEKSSALPLLQVWANYNNLVGEGKGNLYVWIFLEDLALARLLQEQFQLYNALVGVELQATQFFRWMKIGFNADSIRSRLRDANIFETHPQREIDENLIAAYSTYIALSTHHDFI